MPTGISDANLIPDVLAVLLFTIALFISIRSLHIYTQVHNQRLFILGVSMGVISLTAIADLISSNLTGINLNTDWFLYIGQSVSLLFILLSLVKSNEDYFQELIRVHVLVSALLLALLLLSPTLPAFSNVGIKAVLSGSRSIFCFGIFYFYVSAFMRKQTRFSLLMSISFALLAFGYLMVVQQYFVPDGTLFDNIGDVMRMIGLATLFLAIFRG